MLRPGQHPLTDGASGRISMPFLPTLAVAIALAAASVFCPSPEKTVPVSIAAAAPGPTAFAEPAPIPASATPARLPASLAFAEAFPLVPPSASGAARTAPRLRPAQHLAAAGKRSCPARGCPDLPHRAAALAPGEGDPPIAGGTDGTGDVAEDGFLPPLALPFAAAQSSVARTLAPAVRLVGEAAELMRSGGASVKGSVVRLADCLP